VFRDLESAVVADLCAGDRTVLALGGGAVLREQNRDHLRQAGKVVWLQATPATIRARIAADPATADRRPPLTRAGGLAEIEDVLARRAPIYQQCADLVVDTEEKTPAEVAAEIVAELQLTS
jgi:shikimate kinase